MNETRSKLIEGTIATLGTRGIAGVSARAIAASAGVNQALVFYHFGSVDDLIDVACREATAEQVASYRTQFSGVQSLRELLSLGRQLHAQEQAAGNVAVLAQVLAGAQQDARLASAARHALQLWVDEVGTVIDRLLRDSPIATIADISGLAQGVAAAFIGIELYEGVNPDGAAAALAALEQLAVLAEVLDDLGPVARRALRARVRRGTPTSPASMKGT
jgi:AcrR family transcriptional regulator